MFSLPHRNAFLLQVAIGLGLLIGFVLLVRSAHQSLEAQGITSGFGFLVRSTGWDVGFALIPYTINDPYWRVILVGLLNTMFLGANSLVFATLIGIVIGTMRISGNPVFSFLGTCYVEALRNVPLILQVFFWYAVFIHLPPPRQAITVLGTLVLSARGIFIPNLNVEPGAAKLAGGLLLAGILLALVVALLPRRSLAARETMPKLTRASLIAGGALAAVVLWLGWIPGQPLLQIAELQGLNFQGGIRISPEFATLLTSTSLYGGAFMGEVIRAGFLSVGKGQVEAAQALGLSPMQNLMRVRVPLALRMMLPTMTNQYVWLLKATTLGIAVGYSDLFLVISTSINHSGQTLELLGILMAAFLIMNNLLAAVMNCINGRIALRGNQLRM